MTQKLFDKVFSISKHAHTLSGILSLLDWDQETYMPKDAAGFRAEQIKAISGLIHKERVGKKFSQALSKLIDLPSGHIHADGLNDDQKVALKEWRRDYMIEKSLPQKFVEKFSYLTSTSMIAWREARKNKKFKAFAPYLKKIVEAVRKKAEYIGYKEHPYDALLDLYEPGMSTKRVREVFGALSRVNSALLKKIVSAPQIDDSFLFGEYPENKQLQLSKRLLQDMGYDLNRGRLDLSTHPFSSSPHPTDSRVTTRIANNLVFSCISTVLHEGGHSLYEMGLPLEHYGSPLGQAISLGIHESQSRWWETRIGLSKAFWKHYLPIIKQEFPGQIDNVSLDQFYKAINKVEPSFIRVEADEVTYPLHVILRFELESALVEGSLKVDEVPEAWNAKMKEYLGIVPPDDSQGCLQDVHWSMGSMGYFPTYALGNLYAAELFEVFEKAFPNWQQKVETGELLFIKDWLHEHVYKHGRKWHSIELVEKVTNHPFSEKPYERYLNKKYGEIYSLV